jgi:CBS domain containing-hemolysin-like protein
MRRDRLHIVLVSDGRRPLGVITLDDVIHAVVGEPAHVAAPVQPAPAAGR